MKRAGRVPILTWHPQRVSGNDYASNDHVAFAADLELLHRLGLEVVSLRTIAEALIAGRLDSLRGCVGLSIDDGSDFDFHDLPHPSWGLQRGIARILADFRARHGAHAQPGLHVTTFVIVSPQARAILDRTCMIGCRWWNDDWWRAAEMGGLMSVESHGWDHNHPSLPATVTSAPRGAFEITGEQDAEAEIGHPAEVLRRLRGRAGPVLFAYPYGAASAFVADNWLPRKGERLGIDAAFVGDAAPVTPDTSRWRIPRYAFAHDWKEEGELERILRDLDILPNAGVLARGSTATPAASNLDQAVAPAPHWTECLRTWEVSDPRIVAGDLFRKGFGHAPPDYPRHFVLVYSPLPGAADTRPSVVAYAHQRAFDDVYLGGGMVADPSAYRRMPKWLFEQVKREGGLATIVSRGSISMLGDSPASFGHVGEPRARAADLRTGYVDTGVEHLMVCWRKALPEDEKRRLIDKVAAVGAF